MSEDFLAHSDEQHRNYFHAMKDFASTILHHVGESPRLAFRPPQVPLDIPQHADHVMFSELLEMFTEVSMVVDDVVVSDHWNPLSKLKGHRLLSTMLSHVL